MKEILKIGFVGTAISPYYAEEQEVRKKSETQLKTLLENYDVELISFNKTIFSKNDSKFNIKAQGRLIVTVEHNFLKILTIFNL